MKDEVKMKNLRLVFLVIMQNAYPEKLHCSVHSSVDKI